MGYEVVVPPLQNIVLFEKSSLLIACGIHLFSVEIVHFLWKKRFSVVGLCRIGSCHVQRAYTVDTVIIMD